MELKKYATFTETAANGDSYEETRFFVGDYYVVTERVTRKKESGETWRRIFVSASYEGERKYYLPQIRFEDGFLSDEKPGFEIQTAAYGAKSPAEIKKIIAGYEEAVEVVSVLEKHFL